MVATVRASKQRHATAAPRRLRRGLAVALRAERTRREARERACRGVRGAKPLGLKLVVLAIIARCASELPPEFAREVALIRKAAFQGDFGQRFIRVHQGATRNAQPKLSQKFLRGEMEGGTELPFERAERHVRNGREVPIGDLVMEMGAHVGQRGPEPGAVASRLLAGPAARVIPAVPMIAPFASTTGILSVVFQTVVPRDSPNRSSRLTMRWPASTCSSSCRN